MENIPLILAVAATALLCASSCSGVPQGIVFPGTGNVSTGICRTSDNRLGWCRPIDSCPPLLQLVQSGGRPKICGFQQNASVVCCPISVDLVTSNNTSPVLLSTVAAPDFTFSCGRRHTIYPDDLSLHHLRRAAPPLDGKPPFAVKPSTNLGIPSPPVVGGLDAIRTAWPWMALLGRQFDAGVLSWFCDGVLISPLHVLTAAHCLDTFLPTVVRLGEHDHSTTTDHALHVDHGVKRVVVHPEYHLNGDFASYHDLAIVELDTNATNTRAVSPICLPWGDKGLKQLVQSELTLAGWGSKFFGGLGSSILQVAEVTVFPSEQCDAAYKVLPAYSRKWPKGITEETFLCAGKLEGGVDACRGDSGGPLMGLDSSGSWTLYAIVSQGNGCGHKDYPGLYIPVAEPTYLNWIKDIAFA